ncbi:MAG TPA: UDP-glucose 4-epimerase GalE [Acidimicrobiales bacterium]
MPAQGTVLVTGGAGYIGSHTCVALLQAGWAVVVVDDFSNSSPVALERVRTLSSGDLTVERADIGDRAAIDRVLAAHPVDAVIHFAGRKAVGESVRHPLEYYANNVTGTVHLLQALQAAGVRRFVFSSSATVYGVPDSVPVTEEATLTATNPYGRTKLHIEDMLRDLAASDATWRVLLLRYFNPVGAHPSGRIGEDPRDVPNNLMPFVMQVAVGRRPELVVFGDDYPTPDGTCIRDYVHVEDLAAGHVAALERLDEIEGAVAVNLGTGQGRSVLEVLRAAEAAVGRPIPHRTGRRRPGDAPATWADASKARSLLDWQARRSLEEMCADHWRWQQANPQGYGS